MSSTGQAASDAAASGLPADTLAGKLKPTQPHTNAELIARYNEVQEPELRWRDGFGYAFTKHGEFKVGYRSLGPGSTSNVRA